MAFASPLMIPYVHASCIELLKPKTCTVVWPRGQHSSCGVEFK
ncbi:unnamed protein product [Chondrus crispus]|uniref:Uncharacterized protein n=1 Tax=Chondrus crispus TaxID=2769 RepID=R7Q410_CHOCR|nr:unnamed protein product [Chondrus crispus]CDF32071.1 unnamed protein product [Chondrus crispus]|eukprot:XP_005711736.1 unnamed protein product [Chondrus crispus]